MSESGLQKKYGLFTAIALVVGCVIGSGIFFKAEKILNATGGDLPEGILSWLIGGLIMVVCAYVFATLATRHEKVNGVVDYADDMVGTNYGYYIGWFLATIYYPAFASVLAWVSARYLGVLLGWSIVGGETMMMAGLFMIGIYAMNMLSPKLAGKFQISTTVIKLIPLFLMAILGTMAGLHNGILIQNFTEVATTQLTTEHPLFTAVVATAFAYEGWIVATTINSELENAKRNLPIALIFGTIFVVIVYVLYYIGLAGTVPNQVLMESGEQGAKIAFMEVFSRGGGTILFVFVVISCLGTLNGLMMGSIRCLYALSARGVGPAASTFDRVDRKTDMPVNAGVMELLLICAWLVYFYGANLVKVPWFGFFSFDSSELPIVTIYALYIPIFIQMMKKEEGLGAFRRYIMPVGAIASSLFMVVAACYAHTKSIPGYLVVFAVVMILGKLLKHAGNTQLLRK